MSSRTQGPVRRTLKTERIFYSSRDMYQLDQILLFMSGGSIEMAQQSVDDPSDVLVNSNPLRYA